MTTNNYYEPKQKLFRTMDSVKELINDGQLTAAKNLLASCILLAEDIEPL
jgi:soluble cytochrome b562